MQDFDHKHQLNPTTTEEEDKDERCEVCQERILGEAYSCTGCHWWWHRPCAKLPRQIDHPFHRQHPLLLLRRAPYSSGKYSCAACGENRTNYAYHCPICDFFLDVKCASLEPQNGETQMQIQPISTQPHPHPLIPCSKGSGIHNFSCSYCDLPLEGMFLVCLHCHHSVHQSCSQFPQEISHPINQHRHPFTLQSVVQIASFCHLCGKLITKRFSFQCRKCDDLNLDFRCASLKPTKISHDLELQIQNFSHPHPFTAFENPMNFPFSCRLCELPIKDTIFTCFQCKLIVHISCALLPREIKRHPFHPQHPIKLHDDNTQSCSCEFSCRLCRSYQGRHNRDFHYECLDCKFTVHSRCALSMPLAVKFKTHHHPLAFLDLKKSNARHHCNACRQECQSGFFQCVNCQFALHLRCIPNLPPTVKDKYHRHPLNLATSPIKDYPDEGDDAEFFCDSCEKRRNLRDPSYYCGECHYVAHVHCVTSEVLRFLQDKGQDEVNLGSESDTALVEEAKQEITELEKEVDKLQTRLVELRMEEQSLLSQLKLVTTRLDALKKSN
ncbi:uncharacterized protein LOC127814100 [Diospyros lotus]|uniref:uncharacterized protein LOC127814100 n=1 Tax=Diospyros lotus TaxID=55363 RepID=UPI002251DB96|nr:uncharacterized protein LOC127814100 [Diospyros lotus]XP_052211321.1 uncharacterized protein LOC127814100 [Diospyros lotus]